MTNPCIDRHGVVYASQTECAAAHGVNSARISYHLTKHGHLDHLDNGAALRGPSATMKPVEVNGRTWRSQFELARAIGVDRKTVSRWCSPNASKRQKARLIHSVKMLEAAQ